MRQFTRHPTDIPISVTPCINKTARSRCDMIDVSVGGMACLVDQDFAIGSIVNVDIEAVTPVYHGQAEVIWCRPVRQRYEVGLRFVNTAEAYKSRMVQQVCQIEHYKNMIFEREGRLLDSNEAAYEWIAKHAERFPS
jgi:c-di-GMP-binding flagellar brake protein YcgR